MIQLPARQLPGQTLRQLQRYQDEVNGNGDFASRVEAAKASFKARNKKGNATFDQVKATLTEMCSNIDRCMYCEDSAADEVEHHHPKNLYPERVFVWENYLYSCGPCNGPKSDKFAVFLAVDGSLKEIPRPAGGAPPLPPPAGTPVLIDPRFENPLDFLELDIAGGTFLFSPISANERAAYTIHILRLNVRPKLVQHRARYYRLYRRSLADYISARDRGDGQPDLDKRIEEIKTGPHPTVWHEMKRQRQHIPELLALFTAAPEALAW